MFRIVLLTLTLSTCVVLTTQSLHHRRHHRLHPKLFDDFLIQAINAGELPTDEHETDDELKTFQSIFSAPQVVSPSKGDSRRPSPSTTMLESNEEQTTVQDDRQRLPSNRNTLQQYLQRLTDTNPSSRDSNEFSLMDVVRNLNLTSSAKNDTNDAVFTTASRQHLSRVGEPLRSHSRRFASTNSQLNSMEQHMRGIPRDHWSCCALGSLAGDKGFSCVPQYYASNIGRNANRVHNRRLTGSFFDNGVPTPAGLSILETFHGCVRSRAQEFESCCRRSLNDYRSRRGRWREFRSAIAAS